MHPAQPEPNPCPTHAQPMAIMRFVLLQVARHIIPALPNPCPPCALNAGKFHDALVRDIRGRTNAYSRWNPVAEWFGYIKNQR